MIFFMIVVGFAFLTVTAPSTKASLGLERLTGSCWSPPYNTSQWLSALGNSLLHQVMTLPRTRFPRTTWWVRLGWTVLESVLNAFEASLRLLGVPPTGAQILAFLIVLCILTFICDLLRKFAWPIRVLMQGSLRLIRLVFPCTRWIWNHLPRLRPHGWTPNTLPRTAGQLSVTDRAISSDKSPSLTDTSTRPLPPHASLERTVTVSPTPERIKQTPLFDPSAATVPIDNETLSVLDSLDREIAKIRERLRPPK